MIGRVYEIVIIGGDTSKMDDVFQFNLLEDGGAVCQAVVWESPFPMEGFTHLQAKVIESSDSLVFKPGEQIFLLLWCKIGSACRHTEYTKMLSHAKHAVKMSAQQFTRSGADENYPDSSLWAV